MDYLFRDKLHVLENQKKFRSVAMIYQIVKNDIEKVCADEDDPDVSKGLFSLPFMKRAAEKQKKASAKQAQELLAELDGMEPENLLSGRRNFGLEGGTQVSFP